MAKGLFQNVRYKGTIGGVTYRVVNGEYIASNKSSLSKNTVDNSPAFVNTRKLNTEFKGCAMFSRTLQNKFRDMVVGSQGGPTVLRPYLYPEIMKKAREAMSKTTNEVFGERAIMSANIGDAFTGFIPTKANPADYTSLVPSVVDSSAVGSREKFLKFPAFSPAGAFRAPAGANEAIVFGFAIYIPNYIYNSETGTYEPISGEAVTQAAAYDIQSMARIDLSSTATVEATTVETDVVDNDEGMRGLYLVGFGVAFVKTIGSQVIPLIEGSSMRVLYSDSWV